MRTCFLAKQCSSDSSHRRDSKKRTSSSVCQMKEHNPEGGDTASHFIWELAHKENESGSIKDSQSPAPSDGVFIVFFKIKPEGN